MNKPFQIFKRLFCRTKKVFAPNGVVPSTKC